MQTMRDNEQVASFRRIVQSIEEYLSSIKVEDLSVKTFTGKEEPGVPSNFKKLLEIKGQSNQPGELKRYQAYIGVLFDLNESLLKDYEKDETNRTSKTLIAYKNLFSKIKEVDSELACITARPELLWLNNSDEFIKNIQAKEANKKDLESRITDAFFNLLPGANSQAELDRSVTKKSGPI